MLEKSMFQGKSNSGIETGEQAYVLYYKIHLLDMTGIQVTKFKAIFNDDGTLMSQEPVDFHMLKNSTSGRTQLQELDIPQNFKDAIMLIWGDTPIMPEDRPTPTPIEEIKNEKQNITHNTINSYRNFNDKYS